MNFDYVLKRGDTAPLFPDTLTYSNGQPADLSGATVTLVLRSLTAPAPLTLTGPVTVENATGGNVLYSPSLLDSQTTAGNYMGSWVVQFATTQMSFPTVGYLSVRIEENLVTAAGNELISLPDAKDYLSISTSDRTRDAKLLRFIRAARPIVENITGPIIPTVFDEKHAGGGPFIQVRRRPSSAYGTSPVLDLLTATEDWGTTTYDLEVVDSPALGTTYSVTMDSLGSITRLSGGGGTRTFAGGNDGVHITYRAGQSAIPANVYEGTLELLRVNYETTQQTGAGFIAPTDDLETGPPLGFYMPRRVREMLAPNRRAPSVA